MGMQDVQLETFWRCNKESLETLDWAGSQAWTASCHGDRERSLWGRDGGKQGKGCA